MLVSGRRVTTTALCSALRCNQAIATCGRLRVVDLCQSLKFVQQRRLFVSERLEADALGASSSSPSSIAAKANPTTPSEKAKSTAATVSLDMLDLMDRVDLRVGLVKSAMRHPEADMLYVLSVDLGESDSVDRSTGAANRTIVSGLVKYYSSEELLGKRVVVFANIKPRKLRGVASQGMLLAASSLENATPAVEVLEAPEGSCPGDRVTACSGSQDSKCTGNRGGLETNSSPKPLIKRQNIIESFIQDLRLDKRTAMYQGRGLVSENGGYISTKSMVSGTIG